MLPLLVLLKREGDNIMSAVGKLFTKATSKGLSKADKAKLAKQAAKERKLRENQKKPINELQGMTKAEQKEAGMGTASARRTMLAEIGGKISRQKEAYNAKVKQYNNMEDKTTEKAQLLRNSIMDMKERLNFSEGGVVKSRTGAHDFRMNKGGLLLSSVDNRKKR